ncbi:S-adenosylmethionine synthetase [Novosphingobium sp. PP1Y]|nr:S-adenosylmethionine synthetase [Novosphingobium sp. PP1Y]
MRIDLTPLTEPSGDLLPVEIVERNGAGHPDSICDHLTEALSRELTHRYLDTFGRILHYNVDKALLWDGCSEPAFGGGRITQPMEIFLAGRAISQCGE